jgi:hypothetical protein
MLLSLLLALPLTALVAAAAASDEESSLVGSVSDWTTNLTYHGDMHEFLGATLGLLDDDSIKELQAASPIQVLYPNSTSYWIIGNFTNAMMYSGNGENPVILNTTVPKYDVTANAGEVRAVILMCLRNLHFMPRPGSVGLF